MPQFEHDPKKSQLNELKHGISLADAELLWLDSKGFYHPASNRHEEFRAHLTANHQGIFWTCAFALRQGRFRLISCRRARREEIKAYLSRGI